MPGAQIDIDAITPIINKGFHLNGIKLASERLLDQLTAQFLSGFNHQGEALGSPLFDPRLHPMGADGIDAQGS